MKKLLTFMLLSVLLSAGRYDTVKITEKITDILVYHKGKATNIHRIQDTNHHLTGEYTKIFHPCPAKCVQPVKMDPDVETIGEVELIDFIKNFADKRKGVIIDARSQEAYLEETIPSAINIPIEVAGDAGAMEEIMIALGMKKDSTGQWDSRGAMHLVVYCNGLLCNKSAQLIEAFIKKGYPAKKIYYYRGGFQMWKILGFTTVTSKE